MGAYPGNLPNPGIKPGSPALQEESVGCSKSSSKKKFVAIQDFLKKQEKSQINNLTCHLKELEDEEQTKPTVSRRKEIKIREEIKIKNNLKKINKTKSWFFEKKNNQQTSS